MSGVKGQGVGRRLTPEHRRNIGRPLATRFFEKVMRADGCWLWTGSAGAVYGLIWVEGRSRSAHRVSWELHNGEVPEGLCVLHKCDTPKCVNPAHLFLGTKGENNTDRSRKGRNAPRDGVNNTNAKLTVEQVRSIRSSTATVIELASQFSVHPDTIKRVLSNRSYRGVK